MLGKKKEREFFFIIDAMEVKRYCPDLGKMISKLDILLLKAMLGKLVLKYS